MAAVAAVDWPETEAPGDVYRLAAARLEYFGQEIARVLATLQVQITTDHESLSGKPGKLPPDAQQLTTQHPAQRVHVGADDEVATRAASEMPEEPMLQGVAIPHNIGEGANQEAPAPAPWVAPTQLQVAGLSQLEMAAAKTIPLPVPVGVGEMPSLANAAPLNEAMAGTCASVDAPRLPQWLGRVSPAPTLTVTAHGVGNCANDLEAAVANGEPGYTAPPMKAPPKAPADSNAEMPALPNRQGVRSPTCHTAPPVLKSPPVSIKGERPAQWKAPPISLTMAKPPPSGVMPAHGPAGGSAAAPLVPMKAPPTKTGPMPWTTKAAGATPGGTTPTKSPPPASPPVAPLAGFPDVPAPPVGSLPACFDIASPRQSVRSATPPPRGSANACEASLAASRAPPAKGPPPKGPPLDWRPAKKEPPLKAPPTTQPPLVKKASGNAHSGTGVMPPPPKKPPGNCTEDTAQWLLRTDSECARSRPAPGTPPQGAAPPPAAASLDATAISALVRNGGLVPPVKVPPPSGNGLPPHLQVDNTPMKPPPQMKKPPPPLPPTALQPPAEP